MTRRDPAGRVEMLCAIPCRMARATRWRVTDPPTDLLTTKPQRGRSAISGCTNMYPTSERPVTRVPVFVAREKSNGEVSRYFLGSTSRSIANVGLRVTRRGEDDPWRGELQELRGHHVLPYVHGSRASWRDGEHSAERCALSW